MTRRVQPVSALGLLQQEVGELFRRLALAERVEPPPGGEWCPPVDVFESGQRLLVVVEVPGLAAESLRVAFRDRGLVVSGERHAHKDAGAVSFLCLERPTGRFERTIPLEGPLDVRHARATLGRGLLTVTVPRLRERRGQETEVEIEREPGE
ncbi:MAG: Hsp20/alpha crystallin family protein [Betaproteobacteria bacterium]